MFQLENNGKLIGTAGLPSSGKTTAAEIISDHFDCPMVEMGNVVRDLAEEELGDDVGSDRLGEWVTEQLNRDRSFFHRETRSRLPDMGNAVVSGVRTVEDYENVLLEGRQNPILVYIHSDFRYRYDRAVERGREGEDDFSPADLLERERREAEWGTEELVDIADEYIVNHGAKVDLEHRLKNVVGV